MLDEKTLYSEGVQAYIKRGEEMIAAEAKQRALMRGKKFSTIAVHGLYNMDAAMNNQGSIIEPMYSSTAQHFENSDHMEATLAYLMPGWVYSRVSNPTIYYLEQTVAMLEGYGFDGQTSAYVCGSGMAAIHMATNPFLRMDDGPLPMNIVVSAKCYGGTFQLFGERYGLERGVDVRWVKDELDLDEWASKIDENTRFVYSEMPTNPSVAVFDIEMVADLAHEQGIPLIVDATVATAALMRPLCHGADIVIHSMTKSMIAGGLAIGGAIISKNDIPSKVGPDEMKQDFAMYVKLLPARDHGPTFSAFNALMTMNELRFLRAKMDVMSKNALQVAMFLEDHPMVEQVFYAGLESHAGHEIASKYMWLVDGEDDYGEPVNRYGHLMAFTVKGGHQKARDMFDELQMIWRATDLGRVKSVATIPAISTHQQQGEEGRELASLPSNLVRLSVGAEHFKDTIADLDQALNCLK